MIGRIEKNSAFINIFKEKQSSFVCDNLKKLGNTYLNENSNWEIYYNSTAVAPIRYYDDRSDVFKVYGAIAVDSKNENGYQLFENQETQDILGHSTDLLANFFLAISTIHQRQ